MGCCGWWPNHSTTANALAACLGGGSWTQVCQASAPATRMGESLAGSCRVTRAATPEMEAGASYSLVCVCRRGWLRRGRLRAPAPRALCRLASRCAASWGSIQPCLSWSARGMQSPTSARRHLLSAPTPPAKCSASVWHADKSASQTALPALPCPAMPCHALPLPGPLAGP